MIQVLLASSSGGAGCGAAAPASRDRLQQQAVQEAQPSSPCPEAGWPGQPRRARVHAQVGPRSEGPPRCPPVRAQASYLHLHHPLACFHCRNQGRARPGRGRCRRGRRGQLRQLSRETDSPIAQWATSPAQTAHGRQPRCSFRVAMRGSAQVAGTAGELATGRPPGGFPPSTPCAVASVSGGSRDDLSLPLGGLGYCHRSVDSSVLLTSIACLRRPSVNHCSICCARIGGESHGWLGGEQDDGRDGRPVAGSCAPEALSMASCAAAASEQCTALHCTALHCTRSRRQQPKLKNPLLTQSVSQSASTAVL